MGVTRQLISFLLPVLVICSAALADQEKYIQARIYIESPEQIIQLRSLNLDIVWQADRYIEVATDAEKLSEIETLQFKTEIVHEDLVEFYRSRFPDKERTGFLSLSQIEQELFFRNLMYPDLITPKISIGQTIEGRDIYAVKISDNPDIDEDEPEILYTSAIHSREGITPLVLLHFIDHLLGNYGADPEATYLIDNREMWFILVINADGYAYNDMNSPGGGGMWRKNRRDNGDGTYGVDLNRNFGYMWGYDDFGSSPDPDDETYRGTGPFSEPETQVVRDFISAHEFVITLYYHSWSNLVIWPFSYEYGIYTPDEPIFSAMGRAIKSFNGYTPGPGWILYTTNGDSDDWGYGEQITKNKNFSMTIEVGGYDDGFWPETSRIPELVAENLPGNLYLANAAGNINLVLPPEAPVMAVPDSADIAVSYDLFWSHDDTLNPAVNYELVEMRDYRVITDDVSSFENWDNNNFVLTNWMYHSIGLSFFSGDPSTFERYIQTSNPYTVQPNDTLKFWAYYEISEYWDFAYVEVSTDGISFTPIDGNLSTGADPWWHNRGHGITGPSGGGWPAEWVEGRYDLSAFEGEDIYIRFSYKDHSLYYAWWGFFVDDISPVASYDFVTVISSSLTDTSYTISGRPEGFFDYKVRAKDSQDQWGSFSDIEQVVVGNPILYYCGDANDDESVDVADAQFLKDYIFADGPAPFYLGQGDADNCGSINMSDIVYIGDYHYHEGSAPCSSTVDCILPTGGNSIEIGCPLVKRAPEVDDSVAVPIYITNDAPLGGFTVGLKYNSDDISVSRVDVSGSVLPDPGYVSYKLEPQNKRLLIGWTTYSASSLQPQTGGLLATLWLSLPAGTPVQVIDIDTAFVAPAGEFIFSPLGGGTVNPDYIDCDSADITIIDFICGDPNGDLRINILDVSCLINYLYKEGPEPDPLAAGDATGNGSINILDVNHLINYLYKEGPEPVCP